MTSGKLGLGKKTEKVPQEAGIAHWLQRQTRDRKVMGSNPWRSGGRIFFSRVNFLCKLQTLVYDILPSTTAVFSYAIGSRKLSANEQFFVGAQTVVGLLQTTQIKQGVSFIAANKVYTSTNKTTIVWIKKELFFFFLPGVDASHVYVRALALGCFYSHISTRSFGGHWPRRWTAACR